MILKHRRAALGGAIAAALVAIAVAAPAQANTTLPGLNGKIAFTTNADVERLGLPTEGAEQKGAEGPPCVTPFPMGLVLGGDVLWCGAEIATINPDGLGFAQVTNDFFPDDEPAWFPEDGRAIAFESARGSDCSPKSGADKLIIISDCNYDLFSVPPTGGTPAQLTSGPLNELHPSYSPDGTKIAFEGPNPILMDSPNRDEVDPLGHQFDHLFQIINVMPAGGESVATPTPLVPASETALSKGEELLVSDSQPAWSPDGTKIAFTRLTIGETGGPAPVGAPETKGTAADAIVFNATTYVAPSGGGSSSKLETTPDCVVPLDQAPVVLQQIQSAEAGASARTARSATRLIALPEPCQFDVAPAWSPDGSKLAVERITFDPAFLSGVVDSASTKGDVEPVKDSDIVVVNSSSGADEANLSDATEPSCTAKNCSWDQKPGWSPDGTKIVFFSDRDASGLFPDECDEASACDDEIWTMNANGSSPVQLTNNDVNDINPDWQRLPVPPTPPIATPAKPAKPTVGVAGVRRACVASSFHVRFRVGTSASVKSVVVKLDGKRLKSTSKGSFTLTINAKKLKAGRHRLTITATDSAGQVTTSRRTFSVCKAAKPRRHSVPRFTG
jgi:Tol biopolymer transport system component